MTRGKYANRSEAARARDEALAKAAEAQRIRANLEMENAELRERLTALEHDFAGAVSDKMREAERKVEAVEIREAETKRLLETVAKAHLDAYEGMVRSLMLLGLTHDQALNRTDSVIEGFVIKGKWVATDDTITTWDPDFRLVAVTKRSKKMAKALTEVGRLNDLKNLAAQQRQKNVARA